jgi:hypothetical protein
MTRAEFEDLLDMYGGRLAAWPDEWRQGVEELLDADPVARTRLQDAQRIDRLIVRSMNSPGKSVDATAARVLARFARDLPPQRRSLLVWPRALLDFDLAPSRVRLAALAAMAGLGLVLGLFGPDIGAGDSRGPVALASSETSLAAMFEPEPLTGVTP